MSALPVTNTGGSGTQCILLISFFRWGISSFGRASALHAEGERFDPVILHHFCAYGGIGRHAGFRYQCESVGVRVPLGVPLIHIAPTARRGTRNPLRAGKSWNRRVQQCVYYYAPVAQLVEQWFEEPRVSGSNPFGSTN